jgi:predicted secreted protein
MNSLCSLGAFIGIKDSSMCGTYVKESQNELETKFTVDQLMSKTNDHLKKGVKYSMKPKKQNSQTNPLLFQTGESSMVV